MFVADSRTRRHVLLRGRGFLGYATSQCDNITFNDVGTVPHLLLWRSGLHESLVISVGKFVISLEILPCFIGSFTVVTGILM